MEMNQQKARLAAVVVMFILGVLLQAGIVEGMATAAKAGAVV
jgi:hypothetical protein